MTDNKPRRSWPAFLAGATTVALIVAGVTLYREYDRIGQPQLLTNGAARVRLLERGVQVPQAAHALYYFYLEGFTNYREYFSFSAGPTEIRAFALACAARVIDDPTFESGTKSTQWFVNGGPGHDRARWKTPLWELGTVVNGDVFEKGQLFMLVDKDKNRVHVATWGDFRGSDKFALGIPRLSPGMAAIMAESLESR